MIIKNLQAIEDLALVQRTVSPVMVEEIRREVNRYVAATGKDDMESIMLFVISIVGQDSYNQGVADCVKLIREQNNPYNSQDLNS